MAYQYLFPPTTQFQARTGANLTAGYLRVYYTQTDDRAPTYSDFFGTENPDDIVLDNDGRAVVIVDDTKTYRLEVYTYNGACLFTIDPLSAVGGGGGSGLASVTKIISTDGTVQITTTTSAGTTYFDLSTALSPEASRWGTLFGARSVITGDGTWDEIPVITSLGTETYQNGWVVNKDTGYDIAASIEMVNGSSVATKLVEVRFDTEIDGNVVHSQYATIDPSRNIDKASFEWKGDVTEGQIVNGRIFVSSTEALSLGLVSNVLFNEECDGVIGGAGTTYEAGQYVDIDQNVISVTGVQPSGDYTYNSAFSSVQTGLVDLSSTVSGLTGTYIEQSASGLFQPSGNYLSSTESSNYLLTSQSSMFQPSGDYQPSGNYLSSTDASAFYPSTANPSGYLTGLPADLVYSAELSAYQLTADMSGYIPTSESSNYYPASNPSGFVTGVDLSNYATTAYVDSSVSGKLDASASGDFYLTSNPAGYITGVDLSPYQLTADMSAYAFESSNSAKLDASAFSSVSGTFLTAVPAGYATESYVDSAVSGKLDATASSQFITSLPADLATTADVASAVSGKMDQSASGEFYPMTGNPSGFLTAHQSLAGYATEQYVDSSVSGKLDSTAYDSAQFYSTSNPSGFITGVDLSNYATTGYVISSVSGKQDASGMSAYALSADVSGCIDTVSTNSASWGSGVSLPITGTNGIESATYADSYVVLQRYDTAGEPDIRTAQLTPDQLSLTYTIDENDYYVMTLTETGLGFENPEGYTEVTPYSIQNWDSAVDTVSNNSATWEGVTAKQDASSMTAYQEITGMTAYQPAGIYIYESALGWAEV